MTKKKIELPPVLKAVGECDGGDCQPKDCDDGDCGHGQNCVESCFCVGEVVHLASGGPPMTVDGFLCDGRILTVRWCDGAGENVLGVFAEDQLVPCPDCCGE